MKTFFNMNHFFKKSSFKLSANLAFSEESIILFCNHIIFHKSQL